MEEGKRKRLTAKRKFEIYMETKKDGAKVGEILRREGIHLNDLREIEDQVERGAVGALKMKGPGRGMRRKIDPVEYDQLKRELKEKEKAMSDLMVEHMLLKKRDELESRARLRESICGTEESGRR
jgi:transposase-like protein